MSFKSYSQEKNHKIFGGYISFIYLSGMEVKEEMIWRTANGVEKPFSQIDQQHLSNILWYHEVIYNITRFNDRTMKLIHDELVNRFNGEQLLWRPLPISGEVAWLRRNGYIIGNGIVQRIGFNKVVLIGEIGHIDPEMMK